MALATSPLEAWASQCRVLRDAKGERPTCAPNLRAALSPGWGDASRSMVVDDSAGRTRPDQEALLMTAQTLGVIDESSDARVLPGIALRLRLQPPRFKRKVVKRRRLLAMLAAEREHQVVRICAPAGFGKTILAAQLTGSDPRPSCWIQLEDSDNDPVVLLGDLVHMLTQLGSSALRVARELESPAPRIDQVVPPLLGEQLASCDPFVLVLDDLEVMRHRDSRAILSFLVDHAPLGSQVVLVTRTDAEIRLGRLRAAGEVLDLEAADLALDVSETRELLATSGVHLSDDQVEEVGSARRVGSGDRSGDAPSRGASGCA
jgi:hypothetical protein